MPLYRLLALAERLPSPERVVLTWFLRHDPPQPLTGQRKGVAWGKVGRMAAELQTSERTVQRGNSGLIARGILSRDPENQLQYRIHYAALVRAASAVPETVCEGCGRPIEDRERTTKRHHTSACRKRALRRRRRLERERSRRAAACDAVCHPYFPIWLERSSLGGAPTGASPEISSRDAEGNANCHPPVTPDGPSEDNPQGERKNRHDDGISSRKTEHDANPPAEPSRAGEDNGAITGTPARDGERNANCHPGGTLTVTPYQNVKTSKTYNDLNVDRLESESNVDHSTNADDRPKSRRRGSPNNNGPTPAKPEPRIQARIGHPKLQALLKSRRLQGLLRTFDTVLVERALLQADVQYSNRGDGRGIRNAYGLIYAMCRNGFDDELLREREERERRRREREERERRLRELQESGCKRCGFWQVLESGYCTDCDPEYRRRFTVQSPRSTDLEPCTMDRREVCHAAY